MGSPGTMWISRKTTDTTSQITATVYSRRVAMYLSMPCGSGGLFLGCGGGSCLAALDAHQFDAVPLHLNNDKLAAIKLHRIAVLGKTLQPGDHEAAQGLEALIAGKLQVIVRLQVADVKGSVEHQHSAGQGQWGRLIHIKFIFQFADNLLQDVFHRNYADGRAKLINHDRQMAAALFE